MAERRPNYIAVILIIVAAIVISYWVQTRPPITLPGINIESLPTEMGQWVSDGPSRAFDKQSLEGWNITAKDALKRVYLDQEGSPVELMIIYKALDRREWHLSEMCFGGSGYNVKQDITTVTYDGSQSSAVKLLVEDPNTGFKTVSIYLFAQGPNTESSFAKQQLKMALCRIRPSKYGWAYIRVTSPELISEEHTEQKIRDFFAAASTPIRKALTTSGSRVTSK